MYIGTVGFFTDSVQLIVFYRSGSGLVALHVIARRQGYSEPFRQAIRSIVCEHLFFRLNAPINVNYYEIVLLGIISVVIADKLPCPRTHSIYLDIWEGQYLL